MVKENKLEIFKLFKYINFTIQYKRINGTKNNIHLNKVFTNLFVSDNEKLRINLGKLE